MRFPKVLSMLAMVALMVVSVGRAGDDPPWPWLDDARDDGAVSILIMGDTNIQDREDPGDAYRFVLPTLNAADARFCNLEGAFAGTSKDPLVMDIPHKKNWRHSEPDQVGALVAAGIDGVGVANNVTYPWQALLRSLAVLDEAGIEHAGGGKNLAEAHAPIVVERRGTRIGFLSYAATVFPFEHAAEADKPGIAEIKVTTSYRPPPNLDKPGQPPIVLTFVDEESMSLMQADIGALAGDVDLVIVSYHWGVSGTKEPVDYQREVARAAIDSGADVVFGHGPHKYQPVELYKNRPIVYSLANFVFDWWQMKKDPEGMLARAVVRDGELSGFSLVPVWRDEEAYPRLEDPNHGKGRELFGYLQSVQQPGDARLSIRGSEIVIEGAGLPRVVAPGAAVTKVVGGFSFTEGPAVAPDGTLYFTDIPNNAIHTWSPEAGLGTFSDTSNSGNGLAFDAEGNLLVCEQARGRITRISPGGEVEVVVESYKGKALNSPNDLWIDPAGGIYFSDPRYGGDSEIPQDGMHAYYLPPGETEPVRVVDDMVKPNGIVGTPDGTTLYIADRSNKQDWAYDVENDGTLSNKRLFAEQGSDGMTMDSEGNVYLTASRSEPPWAVVVVAPDGSLLGEIQTPEKPSNVAFGGPDGRTLFITARTSVYSIPMRVRAAGTGS